MITQSVHIMSFIINYQSQYMQYNTCAHPVLMFRSLAQFTTLFHKNLKFSWLLVLKMQALGFKFKQSLLVTARIP